MISAKMNRKPYQSNQNAGCYHPAFDLILVTAFNADFIE